MLWPQVKLEKYFVQSVRWERLFEMLDISKKKNALLMRQAAEVESRGRSLGWGILLCSYSDSHIHMLGLENIDKDKHYSYY